MKYIALFIFILCVAYVHFRGKVRYKFWRQLSDHSTFVSPINVFMYLFSRVPTTPYLKQDLFPELAVLRDNWLKIREEGKALMEVQQIKASDKYNDAGFNSFFKTGWKRFYLKWYEDSHPSAMTLCPHTTTLLKGLPSVKAAMFAELPDGSRLPRHRDPYAGSLRYHLGLITPNDDRCFIDVDGTTYS
ncbi:Beta-hydroxylase%2C aspartyl/asparaginyl family [Yersinia enterocolitica]|nr:Beta-hydroxylase%2C aspartyl/asparaginyl family [Yersinia enterocolitica]CRY14383.1 Beta-hydroxylase%2C aspartyl/asparaginyl family [Yersinia enterocolitica]